MAAEPRPFGRRRSDRPLRARACERLRNATRAAAALLRVAYREFWLLAVTGLVFAALVLLVTSQGRIGGLVQAIQDERVANTSRSCEDQNRRNRQTKTEFDATTPPPSAELRVFTFRLVDQLAPYRDCAAVVRRTVGKSEEKRP